MTPAQATKWVNALRSGDWNEKCFRSAMLHKNGGYIVWFYYQNPLYDEIADVIQLVYVEGALNE